MAMCIPGFPNAVSCRPRRSGAAVAALAVLLCGAITPAQAEIYKWKDAQGVLHFSDQPPTDRSADKVNLPPTNRTPGQSAPAAANPDQEAVGPSAVPQVVMYGAAWCGYCKQARHYFTAHGVPYREYDVDQDAAAQREFKRLGGTGVPLILIGEARMQGFSEDRFERLYNR